MLTKLHVKRFKQFTDVSVDLGNPVVFVGPNNSGKTTALQALSLWATGVKRWSEKYGDRDAAPKERRGVAISRQDLLATPVPSTDLLWLNKRTRYGARSQKGRHTLPFKIEIAVEGVTDDKEWSYALEFDYANSESIYCRPIKGEPDKAPDPAKSLQVAYLPPMSGLAAIEDRLLPGSVNVRIGEGRTAEVLRNLCYQVVTESPNGEAWRIICSDMDKLFGVKLNVPRFIAERGTLTMSYTDQKGIELDLSSAGRGLQQVLLILAYLRMHEDAVLLLDEPDAHLEILRQRHIYNILANSARSSGSQILIASHSEVVLREAAGRDVVVAFVGKPHRIDNRGKELLKALTEIDFDQYYQAEIRGWVLYLEGSTDLAILQALAKVLGHPAEHTLAAPFVHYIANSVDAGRKHYYGLREAKPDLRAYLLVDRLQVGELNDDSSAGIWEKSWQRREIENYICQPETLESYARSTVADEAPGPLFIDGIEAERRVKIMREEITRLVPPIALEDRNDPWWYNVKASDEFLDRLFDRFYARLKLDNLMRKTNYHKLAQHVPSKLIASEIVSVLDAIHAVHEMASPALPSDDEGAYKVADDEIDS
ncbi:MAG: hypothetical protein QOI11_435 [Candidatus Eremiobacteraeota bacterium]|jgi:ABC-type taurine transport system ATPase subunit|nr:hypothetical protein [Candidatus Eremiobacteraeota bacterium]